jgi:large subunit ribosomal protein L25
LKNTSETLTVETRDSVGTTSSRALRRSGKVPGVLFGHGAPPRAISIASKTLDELLHRGGKNHLLTITVDGVTDTAMIRAVERDALSHALISVDLQRIGASESITASLPVVAVGVSPGVRDLSGVLDVVAHTLEVSGPADRVPDHIDVDVSGLGIREHLTASQVVLPEGFTLITPADTLVVTVEPPRTITETEEEAPAPSPAEIPLVGAEAESSS